MSSFGGNRVGKHEPRQGHVILGVLERIKDRIADFPPEGFERFGQCPAAPEDGVRDFLVVRTLGRLPRVDKPDQGRAVPNDRDGRRAVNVAEVSREP